MKNLVLLIALVASTAYADGVPIFVPGTANKQADQLRTQPNVASVTPVKVNPHALESNIITAQIEGKEYRFTGKKESRPSFQLINGKRVEAVIETWSGSDGTNFAHFSRDGTSIGGSVNAGGQNFVLYNYALARMTGGGKFIEEPTPEMLERARLKREAEAKKAKP